MPFRDQLLYTFRRVVSFTVWHLGNQDPDWPDEGASFAEADVAAIADYVGRQDGNVQVEHVRRREEIIWN